MLIAGVPEMVGIVQSDARSPLRRLISTLPRSIRNDSCAAGESICTTVGMTMLDSLQGLRRDTGIQVVEFDLGLHESPFVCEGYGKFCRRLVTEVLDEARYGEAFDEFVQVSAAHLEQ